MLTIWGRLNSHNVKKVAWLAEEIGLDYMRHDVGGQFGMDEAYRALNPNALIPTIEDDGLVLWESNAILRYLAARYAPTLWPDDLKQRAAADKWMDWQFAFADAQRDVFLMLVRKPKYEHDLDVIAKGAQATGRLMAMLEAVLAIQPWLTSDSFGIADIPMGTYAHSWFTLDMPRPDMPHVQRWYEALQIRPGYSANVMIALT
jgi:glutathione S-transferase